MATEEPKSSEIETKEEIAPAPVANEPPTPADPSMGVSKIVETGCWLQEAKLKLGALRD